MLLLKVISHLLDYPTLALFDAKEELISGVEQSGISAKTRAELTGFICELTQRDLFDAQESYDLLFDRGRALSLLLFEHVHGESRDRGQAMVDLMNVYKTHGFEVDSSQLPDYIPLYLEFLSQQPSEFIQEWLGDISHILTMLSERLKERDCYYKVLLDTLIEVSGVEVEREEIAQAVSKEVRDDTVEAIDKEWEDREIRFDDPAVGQCPSAGMQHSQNALDPNTVHQVPIKWHEADAAQVSGL
ncbi:nitrate reductase molybdenum cofactor assembly chaperone [Shewanella woodyi]|uniref:Nitrate reductase molybdenum cofactor assembly chaperone n=1 Tax=Shewanella woodyi (strain ATCC 51908 / MS32) TaxID=392500 RepID=B1KHM4_SHEWM|nr:nitrate reductase molybdenum cofactor assembly chaperone [Shewanella woodyi]ACA86909.1 nitrate reductase molybdenum cofactor assembly chaperone [Shewanella woodyi ATCC 51908]